RRRSVGGSGTTSSERQRLEPVPVAGSSSGVEIENRRVHRRRRARGIEADSLVRSGEQCGTHHCSPLVRTPDNRERRDVTERKRAEAEREALRHQLEAVTSNATLGLFMADEQHRCTYLNPAAQEMVGYTLAELRDRPFHEAIHHTRPDGRPYPVSECPIAGTIERGVPHRGEDVFVRRDGRFFPVAYAACPLRRDGRIVGIVLEVRDITAEKRAETERADLLEREHRAREEAEAGARQHHPVADGRGRAGELALIRRAVGHAGRARDEGGGDPRFGPPISPPRRDPRGS
ncbi:MAG: PAS domain S-box protein, partial [Candidatus Rokubacteria bacterium]|nr:PAS domain S-box protein [Candidatus Rokubacteria bacterium]